MALDLSALEKKTPVSSGQPLNIPLVDIDEDPHQPRQVFSEHSLKEMTESIRVRGVKTPVSVRSHPNKQGKWILNYGARRYRGSKAAGCQTIPAFIDEAHDDYDQVIENIQRDDLTAMELALFIKKRLDAGDQKQVIAKNLGKDNTVITQHLALIDPPPCIEEIYSVGKCTSPKTLYELRHLHKAYPDQVERWCANRSNITRQTVATLAEMLKGIKIPSSTSTPIKQDKTQDQPFEKKNNILFGHDQIRHDADTSDLPDIREPLLCLKVEGRLATVLLNRRPRQPGFIFVRFEDNHDDQEVEACHCTLMQLTDAAT